MWKSFIGHLPKLFNICSYWANLASIATNAWEPKLQGTSAWSCLKPWDTREKSLAESGPPQLRLTEISYSHKHCFQFPAWYRNCGTILFSRQVWEKASSSQHYVLWWLRFFAKFTLHVCLSTDLAMATVLLNTFPFKAKSFLPPCVISIASFYVQITWNYVFHIGSERKKSRNKGLGAISEQIW